MTDATEAMMPEIIYENRRSDTTMRAPQLLVERGFEDLEDNRLLVAGLGSTLFGLWKGGLFGLFAAGVGAGMTLQWLTKNEFVGDGRIRRLLNTRASTSASVRASITVDRDIEEVYRQWRSFEFLPRCMRHIDRIEPLGDGQYRWVARVPKTNQRVEWIAHIVEDVPNGRIVWESIPGSDLHNEGMVEFRRGPHAGETEVVAQIGYRAPAGRVGARVLDFLAALPRQFVRENLRMFKQAIESGELPTIEGQTSGRGPLAN